MLSFCVYVVRAQTGPDGDTFGIRPIDRFLAENSMLTRLLVSL